MRIKCASGLVQNENSGVLQNDTRYSDTLFLSARELVATLTNDGVIAVVKLHNALMNGGCFSRYNHFLFCRVSSCIEQVLANRGMEQVGFLRHHTDDFSK